MATLDQMLNAVATLVDSAIRPNGPSQPNVIGTAVFVSIGWPEEAKLTADLAAGGTNVTVYAPPGMVKNTTRNPRVWNDQFVTIPTITATVSGSTITLGGTVTAGHYVSIITDQQSASYAATTNDTLATIASALASQLAAKLSARAGGNIITIPNRSDIVARTAAPGTIMMEVGRQVRKVSVSIWAPSPQLRESVDAVLEPILTLTTFIPLPDTTSAWIQSCEPNDIDDGQKAGYYRRDISLMIEYPTIITAPGYPITVARNQLASSSDAPILQQDN